MYTPEGSSDLDVVRQGFEKAVQYAGNVVFHGDLACYAMTSPLDCGSFYL